MVYILHTATCLHCGQVIEEQEWGQTGRFWMHVDVKHRFTSSHVATPAPDTTVAHEHR